MNNMRKIEAYLHSVSSNNILARSVQSSERGGKRIFWLVESERTPCPNGLNLFSLYALTFPGEGLDSAIELDFSDLREKTAHIAVISASDSDLSYVGLQRAVSNLSRMYSDTLSLSLRSGSATPCLLPLRADITDFPVGNESTLSSFQSSLANSLQSSLVGSPSPLDISPPHIPPEATEIIPKPLFTSSTPTSSQQPSHHSAHSSPVLSSNTCTMDTVRVKFESNPFLGNGTLTNIEAVLSTDTELMDTMLPPQVTEDDVRFAADVDLKQETEWEDESDYTTLEELSKRYRHYGPPPNEDSY